MVCYLVGDTIDLSVINNGCDRAHIPTPINSELKTFMFYITIFLIIGPFLYFL